MDTYDKSQIPFKAILIIITILLLLLSYSLRNNLGEIEDEEATVSICQVRVHFDGVHEFDDRTVLGLLSTLKMHDFFIGQPVWGPSDTLLYLCEHRLKGGFRLTTLERDLHNIIKNAPTSSGRLAWTCA